ncbi:hypothetical protein G6F57_018015 [Rhizopus arrhizus]|nr:hypothetical protein G6F57_018015 [Rhizopus arrhizus]
MVARPQRATGRAFDGHGLVLEAAHVEGVALQYRSTVNVGHALKLGTAFAVADVLLPQRAAILLGQGRNRALVLADEQHARAGDHRRVAAHGQRRQFARVEPLLGAVAGIEGGHAAIVAAHEHQALGHGRCGNDFTRNTGAPLLAAVVDVQGDDLAVQRAPSG